MSPSASDTQIRRRIDAVLDARYASGTAAGRENASHPVFPTGMRRPQGEAIASIVRRECAARTIETGFALGLSGLLLIDDTWMPSVRTAVRYFIENCELEPLVDIGDDPRDWPGSRRGPGARRRNTRGWSMAALRLPKRRPPRDWDHFVEFSVG